MEKACVNTAASYEVHSNRIENGHVDGLHEQSTLWPGLPGLACIVRPYSIEKPGFRWQ